MNKSNTILSRLKPLSCALLLAAVLVDAGCATLGKIFSPSQTSSVVQAVENPNNEASAVQAGVTAGATAFLARNPSYSNELVAVADSLVGLASGNPTTFTAADIEATLAKTSLSTSQQNEISSIVVAALGTFQAAFKVNFPNLNPGYAIFVDAVANGLYQATGNGTKVVPLPVIPWPPAASAATS